MEASGCIEQMGTVEEVTSHIIKVRIHREASCGHCSASGMCYLGEGSERIIEIGDFSSDIKTGDIVGVKISRNMGNKAIILGYLVPLFILLSSLIIYNSLFSKDWLIGLLSLGTLAPWFIILYFSRNRLRKSFAVFARKKVQ
jgi:sigma-E factor negative regulatory protein RseC